MKPAYFDKADPPDDATVTPFVMIEQGLAYARNGDIEHALPFFTTARNRMTRSMRSLATTLDRLIEGFTCCRKAELELQAASKKYAEADLEQLERLNTLEDLMLVLQHTLDRTPHIEAEVAPQLPRQTELPALSITCFGRFTVSRQGRPVILCPNRNGQRILRYLIAQPGHSAATDTLMEILWPEDEQETARHKLVVAASALRRSLNSGYADIPGEGYIVRNDESYELNPRVALLIDAEQFLTLYRSGNHVNGDNAIKDYEAACRLYTGPFLPEDLYSDWSHVTREEFSRIYLTMCETIAEYYLRAGNHEQAIHWATSILQENHCHENAHVLMMKAYIASGRRSEAIQQYQRCKHFLLEELDLAPMPETTNLYTALLQGGVPDLASRIRPG